MSSFSIDDSQWPLVRIQVDGQQSDADVAEFLLKLEGLLQRGEPYFALAEIRRYSPDFSHIKQLARWTLEHAGPAKEAVAAAALVMPSEAFRFLLSSFFLVTPMPCPFHPCTDLDEAVEWLAEQARERGIASGL